MELTEKQLAVLVFVRDWIETKGYSPTYEEIRREFEWASINTARAHINALERKGWVTRTPIIARSIRCTQPT